MFHIKAVFIFALFCITFSSEFTAATDAGTGSSEPCPIRFRCNDIEKVVWATDGNSCFVFRNECHLKNENCKRLNSYIEVLIPLEQDKCQEKCRPFCTADYRPVCAQYNNVKKTFSNSCMLGSHICLTGETYSLFSQGECKPVQ